MATPVSKALTRSGLLHYIPAGYSGGLRCAIPVAYPLTTAAASARQSLDETPSPSPSSQLPENERGVFSKLLLFVPGAITFGLGTWQIFRRQDKIEMLDYRRKRLEAEPINVNASSRNQNVQSLEFRRVVCKGVFDEKSSIFIGPRSRSISGVTENGYYMITPLVPIPGDPQSVQAPVLVNRGWVPRSWRDKALRAVKNTEHTNDIVGETTPSTSEIGKTSSWRFWSKKSKKIQEEAPIASAVEVIGVIRGSEKPSIFVPGNDPKSGQWFYVDVPAIADACGQPHDTIYVEDINENVNPSNPYPIPKDANTLIRSSVMPQDHLNYTLTWYSLSAAVTFMAYKRLKPRKRRSQ